MHCKVEYVKRAHCRTGSANDVVYNLQEVLNWVSFNSIFCRINKSAGELPGYFSLKIFVHRNDAAIQNQNKYDTGLSNEITIYSIFCKIRISFKIHLGHDPCPVGADGSNTE